MDNPHKPFPKGTVVACDNVLGRIRKDWGETLVEVDCAEGIRTWRWEECIVIYQPSDITISLLDFPHG